MNVPITLRTLWLLTRKNLQILIRAKSSALIVIFAPLLLILLLGLSYNTNDPYAVSIGIYAPSFTEDVLAFTNLLEEQNFSVSKYESSVAPCIEDIKSGHVHTCIVLPESFSVTDNEPKEVVFHIDPTRINLVWMIQERVGTKFELREDQISQQLTQDILTRVSESKTGITQEKSDLGGVRDKASSASSTADLAQQSLKTIDLVFTAKSYDVSIVDDFEADLDTVSSKLSRITTQVSALSNATSSEKSAITSLVAEAGVALNSSLSLIDSNDSSGLSELVTGMKADLDLATQKIAAAALAVEDTTTNLDSTKTTMHETVTTLESILTDLTAIEDTLAAQKITEAGTITSPLRTKIENVSKPGTYLSYLFPSILILVVMFSSLALGTTLVMIEKNSPAFFRNFFLPVRKVTFITSIYLTNLILTLIQIAVILIISLFFLSESIGAFPVVALILFITASVFTFMGMMVGYAFNSEETAILASISLGSLCLFISGVVLPLEALNPTFRQIVSFNPFVIAENLIREVFIFNAAFSAIWIDLIVLLSYAILFFLVILLIESFFHDHLVARFMKHHHVKHKEEEKK